MPRSFGAECINDRAAVTGTYGSQCGEKIVDHDALTVVERTLEERGNVPYLTSVIFLRCVTPSAVNRHR